MTAWLRTQGHEVNHKRVARLLRQMGLMAIYPGPRLSQPGQQAGRYPYLLQGLSIDRINQVWSTDITYIRLQRGFLYLVAIIDWERPLCPGLAHVDHAGHSVLSRRARPGIGGGATGDF
jgi:putative transposase